MKSDSPTYLSVWRMIVLIERPNGDACWELLFDNLELFRKVQGSSHNHQDWPGGYLDHVREVMNVAIVLYDRMNALRPLPFSRSDALLVLFLHDLEKPWKYQVKPDGTLDYIGGMKSKPVSQAFREKKLAEYGIVLTPEQQNALKYCEGEMDDYSNKRRVMGPLAAFCHLCDVTSARIWFDCPKAQDDPWEGADRCRR